jgi:hypothetical protein
MAEAKATTKKATKKVAASDTASGGEQASSDRGLS